MCDAECEFTRYKWIRLLCAICQWNLFKKKEAIKED